MKNILLSLSLIAISGLMQAGMFNAPLCQDVKFHLSAAHAKHFAQGGFINYQSDNQKLICSADKGQNVTVTCYPKQRLINEYKNTQTGKPCIVGKGKPVVFNANIFKPRGAYMVQYSAKFKQDGQQYVVAPIKNDRQLIL